MITVRWKPGTYPPDLEYQKLVNDKWVDIDKSVIDEVVTAGSDAVVLWNPKDK